MYTSLPGPSNDLDRLLMQATPMLQLDPSARPRDAVENLTLVSFYASILAAYICMSDHFKEAVFETKLIGMSENRLFYCRMMFGIFTMSQACLDVKFTSREVGCCSFTLT